MHKLKAWFVPHRGNHFHPHFLRPFGLALVVLILVATNVLYNLSNAHTFQVLGYATSISAGEIIGLTNQERVSRGLGALTVNSALTQAAQAKAQDMINRNYWSHYGPDGTTPWSFITSAGYQYSTVGENLAKDFETSAGVVNGWMNSAGHRDNILNARFIDTGVAAINGILLGQETTLVVAMYGAPMVSAPAPTSAPPSTPAPAPPASSATTMPQTQTTTAQPTVSQPAEQPETTRDVPAVPTVVAEPTVATKDAQGVQAGVSEQPMIPVDTVLTNSSDEPITVREQINWARAVSLFLLSVLLLANVLKHTVVWRTQRRGWRHIWLRAHPAAQYLIIFVALVANITTSVGVIK